MEKEWRLSYGIHRGTLMSRDTGSKNFATLAECKADVAKMESDFRRMGYMIWFAEAHGPDGQKERVHAGNSYC